MTFEEEPLPEWIPEEAIPSVVALGERCLELMPGDKPGTSTVKQAYMRYAVDLAYLDHTARKAGRAGVDQIDAQALLLKHIVFQQQEGTAAPQTPEDMRGQMSPVACGMAPPGEFRPARGFTRWMFAGLVFSGALSLAGLVVGFADDQLFRHQLIRDWPGLSAVGMLLAAAWPTRKFLRLTRF